MKIVDEITNFEFWITKVGFWNTKYNLDYQYYIFEIVFFSKEKNYILIRKVGAIFMRLTTITSFVQTK